MRYRESITDFFKTAQWRSNLLLGAVTLLIPLIGPLVLGGWHITCLWARRDGDDPADLPPYDFQFFGKYLERGLWPFLVGVVASLVIVPVMMILMLLFFLMITLSGPANGGQLTGNAVLMILLVIVPLQVLMQAVYHVMVTPLMLRATITQDFKSSFSLRFMKSFLALTWKELLVSLLFIFATMVCMAALAVVTCYIGAIITAPVVFFSWHHLQKQIYQTYLTRGGEPVAVSPKLRDLPPPLPGEATLAAE